MAAPDFVGAVAVARSVGRTDRATDYARMRIITTPIQAIPYGMTGRSLQVTEARRNDNLYRNPAILLLKLDENGKV